MLDKLKKIFFKYNHWLLYIAIVFIIFPILFKPGYVFLTDYVFGNSSGFDINNFYIFTFLTDILSKILSTAFISRLFLFLSLLISIIGAKSIVQNFVSNKWIVFIVSLFGLINPFVYDRIMYGQIGIVVAYGFLMLGTGFLLKILLNKTNIIKNIIFAAVFFSLSIAFAMHFLFFSGVILISFLILFIINKTLDKKTLIISSVLIIFTILILNFSIIFGLLNKNNTSNFIENGITTADLKAFTTSGKYGGQAFWNVLSMSGFWGKDQLRYTDLTKNSFIWNFSFLTVFSLSIYGFIKSFKYFKNKNIKYASYAFISLFLIALTLAIGIKAPIAKEISEFLFNYLPFYKGLREPQKWVSVLNIIYLIFISIGIEKLLEQKSLKGKYNKIAFLLFISFIIILRAPLMLFAFNGQLETKNYPKDWYEINNKISSESNCKYNTLFLPWHMYMNFKFINEKDVNRGIVANPAHMFFKCNTITGTNMEWNGIYDNSGDGMGNDILNNFLKKNGLNAKDVLNKYNIKYIILAKEVDYNNYLSLQALDYLQLEQETANLYLFKVRND